MTTSTLSKFKRNHFQTWWLYFRSSRDSVWYLPFL